MVYFLALRSTSLSKGTAPGQCSMIHAPLLEAAVVRQPWHLETCTGTMCVLWRLCPAGELSLAGRLRKEEGSNKELHSSNHHTRRTVGWMRDALSYLDPAVVVW